MYNKKDRKTPFLFKELFPFGGQLDKANRWLKIKDLIPWEELEERYESYFLKIGRPAKDGQLIIGLMLLKHMTGNSDEEMSLGLRENIYWQAFCGLENFQSEALLDSSSLTKLRQRLGIKFIKELEAATYKALIARKIIKGKGLLVDATVFPEKIKYPNDVSLLNDVRQWLVKEIKRVGKAAGVKIRTYRRKARKIYLQFAKKKMKSKKAIKRAKKQMLQFVRRNIKQLKDLIEATDERMKTSVSARLELAEEIFKQQEEMYRSNKNRIKERIVSFYREYVRPIKRGKSGKPVEFGPKGALSSIGGFLFLDRFSHNNFSEAKEDIVREQIRNYEEKFKKKPPSFTGDKLYGTLKNREIMKEEKIRGSFVALGKKAKRETKDKRWFKKKQKERNRIEGAFGNGKEHYGLERVLYRGKEMSEVWVRVSILGMNLKAALARI